MKSIFEFSANSIRIDVCSARISRIEYSEFCSRGAFASLDWRNASDRNRERRVLIIPPISIHFWISNAKSNPTQPEWRFYFARFGLNSVCRLWLLCVMHTETGRQWQAHCFNLMARWWCGKWKMSRDDKTRNAIAADCRLPTAPTTSFTIFSFLFTFFVSHFQVRIRQDLAGPMCNAIYNSFHSGFSHSILSPVPFHPLLQ